MGDLSDRVVQTLSLDAEERRGFWALLPGLFLYLIQWKIQKDSGEQELEPKLSPIASCML